MEVNNLRQEYNTLQATFSLTENNILSLTTNTSPEYIISGAAVFQVKVMSAPIDVNSRTLERTTLIFIRFAKLSQDDDLSYAIKFSSNYMYINDKTFIDDGIWHLIYIVEGRNGFYFHVTVGMEIVPKASPFAMLHEDTELTDFELRGEDGSVRMHRAVLAAASPVLRRMLSGKWREATEGHVEVSGTSKVTLQNLKDYLYLHTLPDNGLEPLLLLASYYMIKDLEQNCVHKIVSGLTAENVCALLEFAAGHKLKRLMLSILEWVQSGAVKVNDMRDHFVGSE